MSGALCTLHEEERHAMKQYTPEQVLNLATIGRLVKGLVHNVNTPLSAIMGRSEMLQMRLKKFLQLILKISIHYF